MADNSVSARSRRRTWLIGGALLVATVVVGPALGPLWTLMGFGSIIRAAFFPAALLVFAYGVGRAGSVTARRPLGTAAITALAVWMLLVAVLYAVIEPDPNDLTPLQTFGYADTVVRFVLALITVAQVGRAGVVPVPWNWAPAWALAAIAASWLLGLVGATTGLASGGDAFLSVVVSVDSLIHLAAPLFLGILAIVLALRSDSTRTVRVFSSSDGRR
jgi:hypothetical protein